ncbi:MAG: hypothetical protein DHS20C18_19860 [Saprospiraceae bacterium]|nr:MAG: hypothetical protein DHS20C18_19860 [Saprospiraceae bacterium]
MQNTKLYKILSTFSVSEWRQFRDFIQSPFFNKKQELIQLYLCLYQEKKKHYESVTNLDKSSIHRLVFPKDAYDEKKFNHLTSQLSLLAERFLGQLVYEQAGILMEYHQTQACVDRSLHKNVKQLCRKMEKTLATLPYRNADFYNQQYLFYNLNDQYFTSQKIRKFDNNLFKAGQQFDVYFLSNKLALLCATLERQGIFSHNDRIPLEEEILAIVKSKQFQDIPAISVYGSILLMLKEENEVVHYRDFRTNFKHHSSSFSTSEIQLFYQYAINYCTRKIRSGHKTYAEEMLELYQESLAGGYLLDHDQISPWAYKNIIKLGLGLKRFEWVESFIREFTPKLPEDKKQDAFHFNLADLYYHRKAYDEALQQLNILEFSDVHYKLDARVILLKIYYETKEYEALHSLISSFRIFLLRHSEITKSIKTPYLNFLSILNRMLNQGKTASIEVRIKQTSLLSSRSWLLAMVEAR